ncbi:MAG: hypothetical protein KDH95_01870 [Calditrichaeota bacterium]|nr:hypothetical protein [Calditrichota bacterium]MCB0266890.1 hypothetical protein [Calditrichota bacterium]
MANHPLQIAFLWHFHQPYYKNSQGVFQMPWVRFHATRDYLDILLIAEKFPEIRQTFNILPSLAQQILDYAHNNTRDLVWDLSEPSPEKLDDSQRLQMLSTFFLAYEPYMIDPYPRYRELCDRYRSTEATDAARLAAFSVQDIRDLQVWYNLCWMGPISRERPAIQQLFEKSSQFSEIDKALLFNEIRTILQEIVPRYRAAWLEKRIELVAAPFYHPILPLLIDSGIANASGQEIELPDPPFRHPEDARAQIQMSLSFFEQHFGKKPTGLLPPEGALSADTIKLIARQGIKWVATDESIFVRSTFGNAPEHQLHQPHWHDKTGDSIKIFFRDAYLSDAISFVYGNWDADDAATDFCQRLHTIRQEIIHTAGEAQLPDHLVSIICDGENSWEYYSDGGRTFLESLFAKISADPLLKTLTHSDFLATAPQSQKLEQLHPGSRLNANFNIWIAGEEDRKAWQLLKEARDFLVMRESKGVLSGETSAAAWEQIYIAEGSDWCWWYGDEHASSQDMEFDRLFREHLMNVYKLAGGEVPAALYQTIKRTHFDRFAAVHPLSQIQPKIDGEVHDVQEWSGAAVYDSDHVHAANLPRAQRVIRKLLVGYNDTQFFFRIDFFQMPDPFYEFLVSIKMPQNFNLLFSPLRGILEKLEPRTRQTKRELLEPKFRMKSVFEAAISFADLQINPGETLGFQIQVRQYGKNREVFPPAQLIEVPIPIIAK